VDSIRRNVHYANPGAQVIEMACRVNLSAPELVKGKRVLVIEDGPTLTHGEMPYGAGVVAARQAGAAELVDPKPYAVGSIRETYEKYPHLTTLLPAMGYSAVQRAELQQTIEKTPCDLVVVATPIDLARVVILDKPSVRVTYDVEELTSPGLFSRLSKFTEQYRPAVAGVAR
jgi:predicted GTPase